MKFIFSILWLLSPFVLVDGVIDNLADKVRRMSPAGIPIPEEARTPLTLESQRLAAAMEEVRGPVVRWPCKLKG